MMNKNLLMVGAFLGMLAVIIGAFGAHGLEGKITPDRIGTYETGVTYHFYHTFAIFIAAFLAMHFNNDLFIRAGWCFVIGTLMFSGSLYLLATRMLLGIDSWSKVLGPITPIGGLFFIAGWAMILYTLWKQKI